MAAKKFILITFLTLLFFFIARILGWVFISKTNFWQTLISDDLHHYHLGFVLILTAFLLLKKFPKIKDYFLAIGSGMIIDEWFYLFGFINPVFKHFHTYPRLDMILAGILMELLMFVIFSFFVLRYKE